MLGQTLTIARNTFVESIRQPIFFVLVMLSGIFQLLSTWGSGFSMGHEETAEVSGDNKLLLDIGLSTIFVFGTLLAAFIATAVISREIENKTVLTVVSKPVGRPTVLLGKYLGVSGAILLACVTMILFLFMGLRHGVMSTAADSLDGPVLVFALSAVALAVVLGAICNYLYGWIFSQTTMVVLLPAMLLAYLLVLFINKKWQLQPIGTDFKVQITIASVCLTLAILVLTAVATAVSTRLGQVMTIVVCAGVFLFGLLSNHFVGRHAFHNRPVAIIESAAPAQFEEAPFLRPGDTYTVVLESPPTKPLPPGAPFYYGPNPNGFRLPVPAFPEFTGDVTDERTMFGPSASPAVVVTEAQGTTLTIRNIGAHAVPVERPPQAGDSVFLGPTRVNRPVLIGWALIPNMHYFWLLDAISQNQPVPPGHVVLIAGYSLAQIAAFLSLGIVLFQKRDVG